MKLRCNEKKDINMLPQANLKIVIWIITAVHLFEVVSLIAKNKLTQT